MLTWLPAVLALWVALDLFAVLMMGTGGLPPRQSKTHLTRDLRLSRPQR